jgi:hypothetical protein
MEAIVLPILALSIPIVIVPTALAFKHARFLREVEHEERMKAMELGRLLPEDEAFSPAKLAAGIGIGVPIGSFFFAWLADLTSTAGQAVWPAVGSVGLGGVICGTILAARHFATRNQHAVAHHETLKPEFDPDAYDVVGRRG